MFADLVKNRRSIREYEDRPVEPEKIDTIIESALRAPSGRALRSSQIRISSGSSPLQSRWAPIS